MEAAGSEEKEQVELQPGPFRSDKVQRMRSSTQREPLPPEPLQGGALEQALVDTYGNFLKVRLQLKYKALSGESGFNLKAFGLNDDHCLPHLFPATCPRTPAPRITYHQPMKKLDCTAALPLMQFCNRCHRTSPPLSHA